MTPDEVIKEAIEKLEAAQHDAFVLGAYQTLKEAGATDEEAKGLIKKHMALAKVASVLDAEQKILARGHGVSALKSILEAMGAGRQVGHSSGLKKGLVAGGAGGLGVGALAGHKAK